MSEIEIYKSADNNIELQVNLDNETVWLNRQQLSILFDRDIKTIGKHINNVFIEGELEKASTVAKFATVQIEGERSVEREIEFYNLDVIISVGYRVKSVRGTQFRQWATQRLKDYLVKGYAANQKRLEQLQQTIQFISGGNVENLQIQEAKGLLEIIRNYTNSFALLSQYDAKNLTTENLSENIAYVVIYKSARSANSAQRSINCSNSAFNSDCSLTNSFNL